MKSLLYITSVFAISIFGIFAQSELSVNFNLPEKIKAGESFILDIEIDKGDIANFSKLQLNIPKGFSAELIDCKNGTFTFYDQKIKLIWISLPKAPKFNVQVKINVDTNNIGQFDFKGKISYILGSTRKEKELKTPIFNIEKYSKPSEITKLRNNEKTINKNNKDLNCTRKIEPTNITLGETILVKISVSKKGITGLGKIIDDLPEGFIATEIESNGAIFSTKENQVKFLWMTLPSEETFTVSYKIKLDNKITGSKVIEGKMSYLDGDETKTVLIEGTSIITTEDLFDNKITINDSNKIVALNNSNDETTQNESNETVVQNNSSDGTTQNDSNQTPVQNNSSEATVQNESNQTVEQNNSNDETTQNDSNQNALQNNSSEETAQNESDQTVVQNNSSEETAQNESNQTIVQNNSSEKTAQDESNQTIMQNNSLEETAQNDSNQAVVQSNLSEKIIQTNTTLNYRVQICATRKKVNTSYFIKNHQINQEVYANTHEGWHKYTVGQFPIYKSARNHREIIKNKHKIKGPFVTAYNNGTRITVQEALMISKDQWVQ